VLVDQGGAGRACFQHVVHSRQFREIERDRLRNVFGFRPCGADAHGYQLADMTDLVGGERRLLRYLESAQARHRADRLHAGELRRGERGGAMFRRDGNAAKAGVRDRAADEGDVLHSGQLDVGNELPTTAHEAIVLLSDETSSDTLCGHCL
jgi:hypothetical protein